MYRNWDARVGRGVRHERGVALLAGDGDDVDDPPALPGSHQLHRRAADEEHAGEIDGDDLLPVLVGQLPRRKRAARDAGVVDDDVEPALPVVRGGYGAVHVRRARDVGHDRPRLGAETLGGALHGRGVTVEHHHAGTVGEQALADREADAPARARHERGAAVQARGRAHASAWVKSSIRSSGCSRPIDTRSRLTGVVVPGPSIDARCSTRLSVPPKLVARVKTRIFAATAIAASAPPLTCTESMPPNIAIWRRAMSCPGLPGSPG